MVESNVDFEQFSDKPPDGRPHSGCGSCGTGSAYSTGARHGDGLERAYATTAVRFGYMRYVGEFTHPPDLKFTCGARVVIQTQRGIEIGEQVTLTCGGCEKAVTPQQVKDWVARSGEDTYMFNAGRILREATAADLAEYAHIQADCRGKRDFADQLARQHDLPLKVVECECPFGGERIIFYFAAAERVDFRAMVKDLAKEYRTRIEMRQIGARDEARLLADYETCGREICCKVFLKTLKPISMRMAKVQKATLDPLQVSGRCGRLKCCLRYEHSGYEELDKRLPRVGVRIRTNHGEGVVVNRQVLTQLVQIRAADDTLTTVVADDITEVGVEAPPAQDPTPENAEQPRRPRAQQATTQPGAIAKKPDKRRPAKPRPPRRGGGPSDTSKPKPQDSSTAKEQKVTEEGDAQPSRRRKRKRRPRRRRGGRTEGSGGGTGPPASD